MISQLTQDEIAAVVKAVSDFHHIYKMQDGRFYHVWQKDGKAQDGVFPTSDAMCNDNGPWYEPIDLCKQGYCEPYWRAMKIAEDRKRIWNRAFQRHLEKEAGTWVDRDRQCYDAQIANGYMPYPYLIVRFGVPSNAPHLKQFAA